MRLRSLVAITLFGLSLTLGACKKEAATTEPGHHEHGKGEAHDHGDVEGKPVVVNYEAKTGDVTVCPVSGKKFEVTDDSPRMDWQGKSWVFCCPMCLSKVEADPEKHLGPLLEDAPADPATDAPADAAAE